MKVLYLLLFSLLLAKAKLYHGEAKHNAYNHDDEGVVGVVHKMRTVKINATMNNQKFKSKKMLKKGERYFRGVYRKNKGKRNNLVKGTINNSLEIVEDDKEILKKGILDVSPKDFLRIHKIEVDIEGDDGTKKLFTFDAVSGHKEQFGFLHGESKNGGLNLQLMVENNSGEKINNKPLTGMFGSLLDIEENMVYLIQRDAVGNTTVIGRSGNSYIDEDTKHGEELENALKSNKKWGGLFNKPTRKKKKKKRLFLKNRRKTVLDDGSELHVMVIYTRAAECKNSGLPIDCTITSTTTENILARIKLAIGETNTAFRDSRIYTRLVLVHTYLEEHFKEAGRSSPEILDSITNVRDGKDDGNFVDVKQKREEYGADIVSLWVDRETQGCGLGWVGPAKEFMFNIVFWACGTGYFTFAHEVVHNLGCKHDRGTMDACSDSQENFGFRDPNSSYRDIMAYNCRAEQCDKSIGKPCPRVQRFSNTYADSFPLGPIGDVNNDCAHFINVVKSDVAKFYATKVSSSRSDNDVSDNPSISPSEAPSMEPLDEASPPPSLSSTPPCRPYNRPCNDNALCCSGQCRYRRCAVTGYEVDKILHLPS